MRVLVTRPLPDGERTAAALRRRGHDVLLVPLMQVRPVPAVIGVPQLSPAQMRCAFCRLSRSNRYWHYRFMPLVNAAPMPRASLDLVRFARRMATRKIWYD